MHPHPWRPPAGTFRGIVEKLDYLAGLGVNAIELMPVHEFNELEYYQVATALCTAGQQGRAGGGRARL